MRGASPSATHIAVELKRWLRAEATPYRPAQERRGFGLNF
jgi:hypothetical protein